MDKKSKNFKDVLLSFFSKFLKWQVVVGIFTIIGVVFTLWTWHRDHPTGYGQIVAETAVQIRQLKSDCTKYKIDTTDIKNDPIGDMTYIKDFQECALEFCSTYELFASSILEFDKSVDTDSLLLRLKIGYSVLLKMGLIDKLNVRMINNELSCTQIYINKNMNNELMLIDFVSIKGCFESSKKIMERNNEIKERISKCILNNDSENADKALTQFLTSVDYAKYYKNLTTMYINFNKLFNSRIAKTKNCY